MRLTKWRVLPAVMVLSGTAFALADTMVELSGVHLCCPACVKAVAKTVEKIDGVSAKCDQSAGTVTITAKDDAAAQKTLDALAAAGFHGKTGSPTLTIKETTNVPKGKVKTLTLTGLHNCCGACNKKIKSTLKGVAGVEGDTAQAKSGTFDVTGDFEAGDVVKALSAAGFHVEVK
jgi:copper chaperone CopZ